jgi:hypothetical protein
VAIRGKWGFTDEEAADHVRKASAHFGITTISPTPW